ncbi:NAD(P)-dependent oxidoreductase [Franzmannia qiaohouensis]|uniref:NAD(P)-dependent oxidoreductase n=1 Tax=Franzmannia qiaohouensis TaxID=1329370 RepID=A0ABU1HKE5_9GAMM|nr:NAD(P)-dependent oxidoreductase [Halomonas qiaohouensis]MDR5907752.1 NAD(P)-dependent oxidoreductase [Halomonas qiaohouensis]
MKIVFLDSETVPKDIPLPAWTERCENLTLAPNDSTVEGVAESVISAIYALRSQLIPYSKSSYDRWSESSFFCVHLAPIHDVKGAILGIVGKGDIGKRVGQLAEAVGMKVIFAERKGADKVRSGYMAFEAVLRQSDMLSLHCPAVPGSINLIGNRELPLMKEGACLINTARGTLVDAKAVLASLNEGHLGGAALDVLESEPPSEDHPLICNRHPRLIITPHVAWASMNSVDCLIDRVLENLDGFYHGEPVNLV